MTVAPDGTNPARAVRVLHGALTGGLLMAGAALAIVQRVAPPAIPAASRIGLVLATVTVAALLGGTSVLRPRIPPRRPDQSRDAYWDEPGTRAAAIVLWAATEGPGLLSAVGYYLSGSILPALAFGLALWLLILCRPARLEGEGVA
jgi:hypothetical protein